MQAELNKYFYNDITNIILDYHYKTMFNESVKVIIDFIKVNTSILDSDDEDDEDNDNYEIYLFRLYWFQSYGRRFRRAKRQHTMNEEDTDSDEDGFEYSSNGKRYLFPKKTYHENISDHYSPEEFAYKIRYPEADDSDSDCDW